MVNNGKTNEVAFSQNAFQEVVAEYIIGTARSIDEEVRRIIDEQYAVVLDTLDSNLELLRKTAAKLLVDEVIESNSLLRLSRGVISRGAPITDSETNDNVPSLAAWITGSDRKHPLHSSRFSLIATGVMVITIIILEPNRWRKTCKHTISYSAF